MLKNKLILLTVDDIVNGNLLLLTVKRKILMSNFIL